MTKRILCFSDLHCDRDAARHLVEQADDVDLVIGAGDFANRHQGIHDTLDILASIDAPAVLVPGNGETFPALRDAATVWDSANVLHGTGCIIDGLRFWGVGGGIPVTPFGDWSYDFSEAEAGELLRANETVDILVIHSPPLGTVDHDSSGRVRGSQAIFDGINAMQPSLAVCGHIHSDWQRHAAIGRTIVLNAGPRGMIVELAGADATVIGPA